MGVELPVPFIWTDGLVRISWSVVRVRSPTEKELLRGTGKAAVWTWLPRRLSSKACFVYIFAHILCRLSVLPLCRDLRKAIERFLFFLLWSGRKPKFCRAVYVPRPCYEGGSWNVTILSHRHASGLFFLRRTFSRFAVLGTPSLALPPFLGLSTTVDPVNSSNSSQSVERPCVLLLGPVICPGLGRHCIGK